MPDNCKNFSSAFSLKHKLLRAKNIDQQIRRPKPIKPHPLVTACRLRELLESGVVNTKAELARRTGLSRARITQLLNLLKLPSAIVAYLADCADPDVLDYFTERRLRPMTLVADKTAVLNSFSATLSQIKATDRDSSDSDQREALTRAGYFSESSPQAYRPVPVRRAAPESSPPFWGVKPSGWTEALVSASATMRSLPSHWGERDQEDLQPFVPPECLSCSGLRSEPALYRCMLNILGRDGKKAAGFETGRASRTCPPVRC